MADKFPQQADGKDGKKGAPDGVNDAKTGTAGESAGGAQPGERKGVTGGGSPGSDGAEKDGKVVSGDDTAKG